MERHFIFVAFIITFIAQNSNILYPSQQPFYNIVLFFKLYAESKILTFANKNGRSDMVARKVSNENILIELKKVV